MEFQILLLRSTRRGRWINSSTPAQAPPLKRGTNPTLAFLTVLDNNGQMFGDGKNLKDSLKGLQLGIKDRPVHISYDKTQKLITALYMVTDIIDMQEPLRNKLRTLGTEIISDIQSAPLKVIGRVSEIVSFLGIASAINIISEMNANILRKEFLKLDQSVREYIGKEELPTNKEINLNEFFKTPTPFGYLPPNPRRENSKGHTRIGVQKGSSLMQALSDKNLLSIMSDKPDQEFAGNNAIFVLKEERHNEILDIIKSNNGSATIKDIKDKAYGSLINCSEKTLQRELVSMVKEGALKKTGEKRWSRYLVANL